MKLTPAEGHAFALAASESIDNMAATIDAQAARIAALEAAGNKLARWLDLWARDMEMASTVESEEAVDAWRALVATT